MIYYTLLHHYLQIVKYKPLNIVLETTERLLTVFN